MAASPVHANMFNSDTASCTVGEVSWWGLKLVARLQDAELPRLLSARCHMVLSTDDENVYFLQHAEEAVRILNVDCREGLEDPANFPQ